jgi:hypothetical protein
VAVEDLIGHAAVRPAVYEGQRVRAVPGNTDNGDRSVGQDTTDGGVGMEVFESHEARTVRSVSDQIPASWFAGSSAVFANLQRNAEGAPGEHWAGKMNNA